jgi:hypothetical protein
MEKVTDLTGNTVFANTTFNLNPADSALFPIFSNIAKCYARWRPRVLNLIFRTTSYTASGSNTNAGKVICVTNPDPNATAYVECGSAENTVGSVSAPPFKSFKFDCLRGVNKNNWLWLNDNDDIEPRTTSAGLLQVITANNAANVVVGELYVEYAFDMADPIQPAHLLPEENNFWYYLTTTGSRTDPSAGLISSPYNPNGAASVPVTGSSFDALSFPPTLAGFTFIITICVYGSSITTIAAPTISGNIITTNFFSGGTSPTFSFQNGSYAVSQLCFTVLGTALLYLPSNWYGSSGTQSRVEITMSMINTAPPIDGRRKDTMKTLLADVAALKASLACSSSDTDHTVPIMTSEEFSALSIQDAVKRYNSLCAERESLSLYLTPQLKKMMSKQA